MTEKSKNGAKDEDLEDINYSSAIHWSYGIGGFFTNFIAIALGVRVIFFYENVLFLDILLIGIALVILGFWNMINDPLMGYLSDRTS